VKLVHDVLSPVLAILKVKVSLADRTVFVEHQEALPPEDIVQLLNVKYLGARLQERGDAVKRKHRSWREWAEFFRGTMQVATFVIGVVLQVQRKSQDVPVIVVFSVSICSAIL